MVDSKIVSFAQQFALKNESQCRQWAGLASSYLRAAVACSTLGAGEPGRESIPRTK